jgi:CheY-like chemotaxis protein/nitrogen-specific signal transduction histidine kinase
MPLPPPSGPTGPSRPPAATILVVDDEPAIQHAIQRLFRPFDYRVLTAGGGAEGLAILERETVDLVISDIRMPHMGGVEFLAKVAERWPDPVRIVLTAYGTREESMAAINQGHVYGYIAKPWEDHDVFLMVRHALERKRLDAERGRLLAANARMGRMLDVSADPFFVFEADSLCLVQANRVLLEHLGLPAGRIGERTLADLLPGLGESELRRRLDPLVQGLAERAVLEADLVAGNTTFPVEARVYRSDRESPPVLFAAARDVRERKQWEEQVETYMSALEWTNEHLRTIRAEMEARNAELDSHARHLMYGLKGPLGQLVGYGVRLRQELDQGHHDQAAESLKGLVASTDQLADLLADLATFARYTQPLMDQSPVDLNRCVQDALVALKARSPDMGVEVSVDPLPGVTGDEPMLAEMYRHLIATVMRCGVDPKRPRVRVIVEDQGGRPVFGVLGNGGGIGMEAAQAMFSTPGFGPAQGRVRQGEVGLAICKKVVTRHGGTIWVESRRGRETGFLFTLANASFSERPARRASDRAAAPQPRP